MKLPEPRELEAPNPYLAAVEDEEIRVIEPPKEEAAPEVEEPTPFKHKLLPESVAPYVFDIADRMDKAPLSFAGVAALAVLSAAIGRRVGVRPKLYDDWTVVPNLWGMLIAPPSIKKTPIYTEMLKPLIKAEIRENESYLQERKEYEGEMLIYEAELKEYKKKLAKGEREKSLPTPPEAPIRKRYLINDATIEKVAELMIDNPMGLMVTVDELSGFFSTLSRAGREGDIAFWLEAFNGNGGKNIDRIMRGSFYVPHVCASIFGTIQPDAVLNMVSSANNGISGGGGLLQRFQLIAMMDKSTFEPVDRAPNYTARDEYESLIDDILYANPLSYGAKRDEYREDVIYHRFSDGANAIFKEWSISLHSRIEREAEHNPAFSAHLGKLQGLFASLALILFYPDRLRGITIEDDIPEEYALKALELCNYFEEQARALYDMERIKERRRDALEEKILRKVQELQTLGELPISYGELSQKVYGASADECRNALRGLVVEKKRKVYGLI